MSSTSMTADGGLVIAGLSKRFGDVVAVDQLDLEVPRGALIGFLGPNGAGKTTTMRAILGMVRPDAGTISFDGQPISDPEQASIGYMPQERGLYARMRVLDQVIYFGRLAGMDPAAARTEAERWLERVELTDRSDALVQELSGGNQQRVQLAVSLVHNPELLVLDEPFAGLDPVAAYTMRDIIAERAADGASVLFSSHQLDLVSSLCEDVVIIAAGRRVAGGSISELRAGSPRRHLSVRWSEPVAEWAPLEGAVRLREPDRVHVELDADADVEAHIAHALAAAPVVEVSFEPPDLDEMFSDLVGSPAPTEAIDS